MADVVQKYIELSSSTPRLQVSAVLQSIIDAPSFTFNQSSRAELIRLLLKDLKSSGPKSKLTHKDAAQALTAVKMLGRDLSGSKPLSEAGNLSTLLNLSTLFKDDPEACTEALKCIANALFLFPDARETLISKEVGGGDICMSMLDKATNPAQIFTLSRIFFLLTVSRSSFIPRLVEEKRHGRTIADIIVAKLDLTMVSILAGAKFAKEAMSDLLKLAFNILLHYPKMVDGEPSGEAKEELNDPWSAKLEGLLPPLLRAYHTLPPTFPMPLAAPLTHIIHTLIIIPVNTSLRPIWFNTNPPAMGRPSISSQTSSSRKSSTTSNSASNSPVLGSPTLEPSESPELRRSNTPIKSSTIDRALSVISAGRKSLSRSPSPSPPSSSYDVFQRTHDLLEVTFSHHFPDNSDPDSQEVRDAFKKEIEAAGIPSDTSLDDVLTPLVVLCTRLCLADESSRLRMREWTVPPELDRTHPLDERADFLGRCIRLLGSVYHPRLKDAIGEMLYAACDSDATLLSSLFGYGHVAGLLFNKGVMSAPAPPSQPSQSHSSSSSALDPSSSSNMEQREINPITGTYAPTGSTASATADMTEEEKEQEMEKLFVLFDRLERSGSMPASQNPMRKIIEKSMSS
ncbi:guanine nucleotide exchange factor [Lentinula detonsa]|uniref:Guanine nucleotide exchange factor n=1 Tax=Lentinula detonsa TaxID=2804962 RepID=A0AA38PX81_9AGAR|nr:guanine nucleotide exchange factor [Lentinula detonsa]